MNHLLSWDTLIGFLGATFCGWFASGCLLAFYDHQIHDFTTDDLEPRASILRRALKNSMLVGGVSIGIIWIIAHSQNPISN
jgi:hypothetical protein